MKYLVLLISLCVATFVKGQDTTHIPTHELEAFFVALDDLRYQDSIKAEMIKVYEGLVTTDSLLLLRKDDEIESLNLKLDLYQERVDELDKWYRTPWFGTGMGILGTALIFRIAGE